MQLIANEKHLSLLLQILCGSLLYVLNEETKR